MLLFLILKKSQLKKQIANETNNGMCLCDLLKEVILREKIPLLKMLAIVPDSQEIRDLLCGPVFSITSLTIGFLMI